MRSEREQADPARAGGTGPPRVGPRGTPSPMPYVIASVLALVVIVGAWLGRDMIPTVGPGDRAPDFRATWLDGTPASLADFEGRVLLLNVWATWCAPCVEELPSMQRLYEALEGEDFEIVAVSIDASLGQTDDLGRVGGDVGAFAEGLGLTFPILHDPSGRIMEEYFMTGVPESFLIGRDRIIFRKAPGEREWDHPDWIAEIRRLLEQGE